MNITKELAIKLRKWAPEQFAITGANQVYFRLEESWRLCIASLIFSLNPCFLEI